MGVRLRAIQWAARRAKRVVDDRGGIEGLKADAARVREAASKPGSVQQKAEAAREALKRREPAAEDSAPPTCPTCGQPASKSLAGHDEGWECRNEACAEFGQPVRAHEPGGDAPNSAPSA